METVSLVLSLSATLQSSLSLATAKSKQGLKRMAGGAGQGCRWQRKQSVAERPKKCSDHVYAPLATET